MGDDSRMSRANRFAETFNDAYLKQHGLGVGTQLTVKSEGLGQRGDYTVIHGVTVVDPNGREHLVEVAELFEPDWTDKDVAHDNLDLAEDEFDQLWEQADLD